jgi:hypothetical protein
MDAETRVADLKLLSKERWEAHVEAQAMEAAKTGAAFEPPPMPTPTAGALFNRPNPRDENGEFVLPYVRSRDEFVEFRNERMWVDEDGHHSGRPEKPKEWQQNRKYVPVSGKDWTGVRIASHMKYRIPNTSVVNKVGDVKSFLCCGYRLTAAQWSTLRSPLEPHACSLHTPSLLTTRPPPFAVWWLNFLCLIVHTSMVFVTLHFAYWRWGRNPMRDTEHVTVRIYRVTQVPTPYMIENNISKWSPGWNLTNTQENDGFFLRDNGYPVRRQNSFRCTLNHHTNCSHTRSQ